MKQSQTFKFDKKLLREMKKEAKFSRLPFNRYVENLLANDNNRKKIQETIKSVV